MPKNCLIADDSRVSRMVLRKYLVQSSPGLDIVEAENGQEAVDRAKEAEFDVVLLDYNMPVMDGGQAAVQIREFFPQAKIAFLTANVQDAIKNLALNLRIDFIAKPITQAKIDEYLG